jgi:chromosome segregation ATPase
MTTNSNTYFNTDVDALGRHLEKIRAFATESLEAAALRRDAVLAEVRQEEQRLAALAAERRATEKALAEMHDQIARLSRDLELLSANLGMLPPSAHQAIAQAQTNGVVPPALVAQSAQAPRAM